MQDIYWIGGGQWAGKTSIAIRLARKHGLQLYPYDYHSARGQSWRVTIDPERYPHSSIFQRSTGDERWVVQPPERLAQTAQLIFDERFPMVLEDLAPLAADLPFMVEGWGIRPRHLVTIARDNGHAVFLVPTERFVEQQVATIPRAQSLMGITLSDPVRAQSNRLKRDRLLRNDCVAEARRYGFPVVKVTGRLGLDQVTARVERLFGLPSA